MAPQENISIVLKQHVKAGWPDADRDFEVKKSHFDVDEVDLKGGVAVKLVVCSVDPYMRGKLKGIQTYTPPFNIGEPLYGDAVVRVVKTATDKFSVGSLIVGRFRWELYSIYSVDDIPYPKFNIVPSQYNLPASAWVGAAGMPGHTAWHGLNLAEPKAGEMLFVSAAAGAVGQVVGGLALARGLKVIGSAGSDEKVKLLVDELGFDPASFNYKKVDTGDALKKWVEDNGRKGIDVYFDNVGGETLDAALANSADKGRIICCGAVSQYNLEANKDAHGLKNSGFLIYKRLRMQGFIITDHLDERLGAFYDEMPKLLEQGKLMVKEAKVEGLENAPEAFVSMLRGDKMGKVFVQVSEG